MFLRIHAYFLVHILPESSLRYQISPVYCSSFSASIYVNGEIISENGVKGVGVSGENQLVFEVLFDAMNDLTGIALVSVYQNQQPNTEEVITLKIE